SSQYRNVETSFTDPCVGGNAIYILRSKPVDQKDVFDVAHIAYTIRRSIEDGRDPAFIGEYMSAASYLMNEAANADRSMFFAPELQTLSVNS
ncbi:hypothetical protein PUNSTDRAFT_24318, partial [Punctularia strigosozonata HHB-11173 SS5]|uniref:uncharacterized protein n=1 Tax=Punctularia strigosozonata (strain HHB-11173) TaxID=741275 RepID=UPI0004417861